MNISKSDLNQEVSLDKPARQFQDLLHTFGSNPQKWLAFLSAYTTWNRCFGSAVAGLASRIGQSRDAFADSSETHRLLADRSVLVASYFFDAARDEFDDRDTAHRDTHRCLAQACVKGFIEVNGEKGLSAADALVEPAWLRVIQARVFLGYGVGSPVERPFLFRAMGYHLGSEVLADQEFSLIDSTMRQKMPDTVEKMSHHMVDIGGERHNAYQWLRIHSGHGGGVEADHFAWAVKGVTTAFAYVPAEEAAALRDQVLAGFADFARDQHEFVAHASLL
jgi:hypothetical protein